MKFNSLTPEELNEFRKFNKTYDEQQVLKTVLPYFVSLTKEEIEVKKEPELRHEVEVTPLRERRVEDGDSLLAIGDSEEEEKKKIVQEEKMEMQSMRFS